MTHLAKYSRITSDTLRPSALALHNAASQSSSGMRTLRSVVPLGIGGGAVRQQYSVCVSLRGVVVAPRACDRVWACRDRGEYVCHQFACLFGVVIHAVGIFPGARAVIGFHCVFGDVVGVNVFHIIGVIGCDKQFCAVVVFFAQIGFNDDGTIAEVINRQVGKAENTAFIFTECDENSAVVVNRITWTCVGHWLGSFLGACTYTLDHPVPTRKYFGRKYFQLLSSQNRMALA